jgi:subtilisin family serine protease
MTLRIGLLDSGIDDQLTDFVADSAAFYLDENGNVKQEPAAEDRTGHGSQLARIILCGDGEIELLSAQVFSDRGASSPVVIAAGLDWLVKIGARVINMSLGLATDRSVMREACLRALKADVFLVASSPPRGEPVYPAAYEGVIGVSGDARCKPWEHSYLGSATALFGACVHAAGEKPGSPGVSGASIAAAHMTREVARQLRSRSDLSSAEIIQKISENCHYHGAEKRTR